MEPDHWIRVKEILAEALDQTPAAQESFVRDACGADAEVLQSVLKLLHSHHRASGDLSQPLFPAAISEQADRMPRFLPSMVVGRRFQIIRLIARGGIGDIYEAEDEQLGLRVALKTIRPDIARDQRVLNLFKNEIQMARRVTHPNVCRIYDLAEHSESAGGSDAVTIFFTMELLAGETLTEYLKTHGPFSREDALPIIGNLAAALDAAHQAGVIHRDFKPGNVMLMPTDAGLRVAVTDFGLAVARAQEQFLSLPDAAGGTPAYMAPEQRQGGEVTPAADIYSLGLVLAELIGGRVQPFRADPADVQLDLPQGFHSWEPVLLRCLDQDPLKRYQNPVRVVEALIAVDAPPAKSTRSGKRFVAFASLLIIFGVTFFVAARYREWPARDSVRYQKLGQEDGNIELWRPSPDGRFIAITDLHTGNLGLRNIATGEVQLLSHRTKSPDEGQVLSAVFSPDGNQIAYSWLLVEDGATELRINDTRNGADTLLYKDPAQAYCEVEDWSPDDSLILAHCTHEDASQLRAISIADHSMVALPLPPGMYGNALFAPDSAHVVYNAPQKDQSVATDIFEVPIHGGAAAPLVRDAASDHLIGFSPDGRSLIFSSDRNGIFGLWSAPFYRNSSEGNPAVLANNLGRAAIIGMTRQGTFFYTVATNSIDVYTAEIDTASGQLQSGPDNVVSRFRGSFGYPSWSANGEKLSFMSGLDVRPRIWVYIRQTGEIHFIQPKLENFQRPQWDPAGNRLFVTGADRSGRHGIFRVDAMTGDTELVLDRKILRSTSEGAWAKDGRTLFNRFRDPHLGIFKIDAQTAQRQILYEPPANLTFDRENLALSPDEKTLAFQVFEKSSGKRSLMVIPTAGGAARTLLTIESPEEFPFGSFAWSADSTQILAVRTKEKVSELLLVPVNGDAVRRIEFKATDIRQLRMNPNGRTIAFTSGEAAGEVWVAENLLPR